MAIQLLYDRGTLPIEIPPGIRADVIRKRRMPLLANPSQAVAQALAQPVNSTPLVQQAQNAQTACILICDITRPVPNGLFLGPIVKILLDAGIQAKNITILIATGLHRANLGEELAELVGDPWVLEQITIVNHDAQNDADHVDLGFTPSGRVPIKLDRRFVDADLKIATGLVEPHFMAGYSGGRKVIAPGIAHQDTIRTFHNSRFMSDPLARNCNLAGNPLHEEQLAIVDRLGGALALNTVIDDERRLAFVNFGEIKTSHLAAVEFIRRYAEIRLPRLYDVIVTSSAGYPLDKTYYQTVKGMVGPIEALTPGGELIIVSGCEEGLGSEHYRAAQERLVALGVDGFASDIAQRDLAEIDEWQTQMQVKAMRAANITLVTDGLNGAGSLTGVQVTNDLQAALSASLQKRSVGRIAVVPEGPYVVPTSA